MNKIEYIKELIGLLGQDNVKENEDMSKHSSFKAGGKAEIFAIIDSAKKLEKVLKIDYDIPITVIGNGSNILVKDTGIKGLIIKYTSCNYEIEKKGNHYELCADAGLLNGKLAYILLKEELTGFEFASGIPGTLGGAIFMNAGAYGKEMCDIVKNVTYIDLEDRKLYTIENKDCSFSYRKSIFMEKKAIIISSRIILEKGKAEEIKALMDENLKKRIATQPIEYPNGGSTFKRGDGFITAKLIDEAGLKGKQIGGAQVSKKHAGFIINYDNATADDILKLAELVQNEVYKKFNKRIELEVRILGQ